MIQLLLINNKNINKNKKQMSIDVNVLDPQGKKQQQPKSKNTQQYVSVDYASLRNMTDNRPSVYLLPGLGKKGQKISVKNIEPSLTLIEEPQLLSTAKEYFKEKYEEPSYSQTELENHLALSSFMNSREPTPYNPLLQNNSRRKTGVSQKNKVNSMVTELFDIQSNPQVEDSVAVKIKKPDFRLYDTLLGQGDIVYAYVFGKNKNINPKLIKMWKDCLNHEDKAQIYLPVGEEKVEVPYSHARVYPLNQIEKEFKSIYGTGKNRSLTAGEEAVLLESIRKYLDLCSRQPLKIGRKDYDIMEDILKDCKLPDLQAFPLCMKQAQTHFRLMSTKWKYSGNLNMKDRLVQSALVMGKNNFIDLTKSNILTEFLLNKSNIDNL